MRIEIARVKLIVDHLQLWWEEPLVTDRFKHSVVDAPYSVTVQCPVGRCCAPFYGVEYVSHSCQSPPATHRLPGVLARKRSGNNTITHIGKGLCSLIVP